MAKYLITWKIDQAKIPLDPKQRGEGWGFLLSMVKQDIEKKLTTDWGAFVGEASGYSVLEGSEVEVMKALQRYVPYCVFKVHPIATVRQVEEMLEALAG
ncbi:MAG: hypothetical protein AMJ54_12555 [Deltaproteobacteria bacterium SG8_13]|nr:MAG: hypothetical protein AMJ54_12555 [Deltaproteobacteria bacterium SG8_13]